MHRMLEKEKARKRRIGTAKKKRKARKIFSYWSWMWTRTEREEWLEKILPRSYNNMQRCSCPGCGNPRRHFQEITLQEKKQLDFMRDSIEDSI